MRNSRLLACFCSRNPQEGSLEFHTATPLSPRAVELSLTLYLKRAAASLLSHILLGSGILPGSSKLLRSRVISHWSIWSLPRTLWVLLGQFWASHWLTRCQSKASLFPPFLRCVSPSIHSPAHLSNPEVLRAGQTGILLLGVLELRVVGRAEREQNPCQTFVSL